MGFMNFKSVITSVAAFMALAIPVVGQNLADLFEEVSESVVVIGTVQNKQLGGGKQNVVSESGLGSGVLVSDDGLIWTAAHVVQVAEVVKVKFSDGEVYDARVLVSDAKTDLAAIKVVGSVAGRKTARIGDSNTSRVGEDVFVIGAPRGLEYSLSRGIISGRMKEDSPVLGASDIEFLQLDAAINPGNSGGPVFNMNGEVIGIASFILSQSGGFEGIGFAATSNVAQQVMNRENLVWGGIEGVIVTGDIAEALNVPGGGGYLIVTVASKGLGAQVGLVGGTVKAVIEETELLIGGDVILELAGERITDDLTAAKATTKMSQMPKGSEVEIKFLRGGEVMSRKFTMM